MHALTNCRIYTGSACLEGHAVLIDGRRINAIVGVGDIPAGARVLDLQSGYLAPGFIDAQVNGGGGLMFNDAPSVETIARIAKAHRRFGTTGLLPTLITDSRAHIADAIDAVAVALAEGVPGVLGIHLEGPNISSECSGIHEKRHISNLHEENISRLGALEATRIVTLAPECAAPSLITQLVAKGVRVSAGHTAATAEQIDTAAEEGLSGITHLFNAMSQFNSREPGVVGAALAHPDLWCSIIVDGFHAHDQSVAAAWRAKRPGKLFLVSDAMASVGANMDSFVAAGKKISIKNGCCRTADGRLAGSTLDMARAVRNCVTRISIPLDEALRMAATYPAEYLQLDGMLGKIKAGFNANLVWLDKELNVRATWIDGDMEYHE